MPAGISARFKKTWSREWPNFVLPFQSNSKSSTIVAAISGGDSAGIALVNTSTGQVVSRIDGYDDPKVDQAFGSADGAHAV